MSNYYSIGEEDLNIGNSSFLRRSPSGGFESVNQINRETFSIDFYTDLKEDYNNNLENAISEIGSEDAAILIKESITYNSGTTIPSNVTLILMPGVVVTIGYDTTINGHIIFYSGSSMSVNSDVVLTIADPSNIFNL